MRREHSSWGIAVGMAFVLTLVARPAAALSYGAPEACPGREAFEAAVADRTEAPIPEDVAVRIEQDGGAGYRGTLTVAGGRRQLVIERCDELVEALALSLALQLERQREERERPPPAEPPREEAIDETGLGGGRIDAPRLGQDGPSAANQRAEPSGAFARIVGGVSLSAWLGRGRGARPEPGIEVGIERVDGWWSLAARVSAWRLASGELVDEGPGTARFTITAGRLTACPVGYDGGFWAVHPCLTFEVGSIDGEGQLDEPGRADDSWLAGGLSALGTLRPLPPLTLHALVGLATPFTRYRLRFEEPIRVIYELPPVGLQLGGGLGLSWP